MRTWWLTALLLSAALAGCASDDAGPESSESEEMEFDETPEGESNEAPETESETEPEPEAAAAENATNEAPVALLSASSQLGEAPFPVTFTLNGTDADGDVLTWRFDANGDGAMEGEGSTLPQTVNFTFEVGDYNATLWVSDGELESNTTLEVSSFVGTPPPMTEIFYIHSEGSGDGTLDHTPAGGSEGGHGLANLLDPSYDKSYAATEPAFGFHQAGTTVEVRVQGFTLVPHPLVEMTASLTLDGVVIGSGSDTQTTQSIALVNTPCTEWLITFETSADVPVNAIIGLNTQGNNLYHMVSCYPGGESGPRVTFNP